MAGLLIYSARCRDEQGAAAIEAWLKKYASKSTRSAAISRPRRSMSTIGLCRSGAIGMKRSPRSTVSGDK